MSSTPKDIAIIGGGIAGMALALSLHERSIRCTIYELRQPPFQITGALALSPNALRILESLGLYTQLQHQGYSFDKITFKNADQETAGSYYFGDKTRYDFDAIRIYRSVLLDVLRSAVKTLNIPIVYGKKFSHVVSETANSVTFAFADGTTESSSLLIGADGIHSTVRRTIHPTVSPAYGGAMTLMTAIPRSTLRIPPSKPDEPEYPLPVAVQSGRSVVVLAPQTPDGNEIFAGIAVPYPEQDQKGWNDLTNDKAQLLALFRRDADSWPDIVQSAMESGEKDKMSIWAYYTVPRLDTWASEKGRVVIIGDAAHALPPTAGQGAGMAVEDAYSFAALCGGARGAGDLGKWVDALERWQKLRNERVDGVRGNKVWLNRIVLSQGEQEDAERGGEDMACLYKVDVEKDVMEMLKEVRGSEEEEK